jgi:hypothetical protein
MVDVNEIQGVKVTVEVEAADTLAVLLTSMRLEGTSAHQPASSRLREQARTIVDRVDYLDGELAVIEVDGFANAVQIRSRKPVDGRYVEIILRDGNTITLQVKGSALHVSRENLQKLTDLLVELLRPAL